LDQQAQQIYSDALIIHIQLNPDPRHVEFRSYRDRLLRYPGDHTELVCLNWASNICCQLGEAPKKQWGNIAGSAWYLRPDKFDDGDAVLLQNHKRGLYYTWLRPDNFHALFFNYDPAVFILETSKVFHHAVAGVVSRRRGPQTLSTLAWDSSSNSWISGPDPNDGFAVAVQEAGDALGQMQALAAVNPLHAERALALAAGKAGPDTGWYRPRLLDSCVIERTEVIKRMTFCQDNSPDAAEFRTRRFRRIKDMVRILKNERLPAFLSDFKGGFTLDWSSAHPQQNAKSSSGQYATVIYMGEDASMPVIEQAYVNAADNLHKTSRNADESTALKQRLALWYRDDGQLKIFREHHFTDIDKPSGVSEVEFTRSGA